MAKDRRLWMTFPIDFHRHPKIMRLPVNVRWTFVEMNGEARIADNDGVFDAEDAEFHWPAEHLQALMESHPTRPLVIRNAEGQYVIREYAKHQQTRDERERLAEISRANGSKGGRPAKKPDGTQEKPNRVTDGTQPQPTGTRGKAQSQSQSESQIHTSKTDTSLSRTTAADAETDASAQGVLSGLGIGPDRLVTHIRARTQREVTASGALRIAAHLLERAGNIRTTRQQYVLGSITRSPAEVQQFIDENALTA